ncbi:MAG: 4Fe-4S binding protein [Candidatus Cloacimonetes bacterium]|nr:4Fe-4S binding protein [Candidatus Cloacimonadota bacterium]
MKYKVIESLCDVCACCASVCPQNAIIMSEQKATIFLDICIGCAKCFITCPISAIEEIPDES